jgi:hypothetical protein
MKKQNNSNSEQNLTVNSMDVIAVMPDDELEVNIRSLNEMLISNKRNEESKKIEVELAYFLRERGIREIRKMKHTEYQMNLNKNKQQTN